MNVAEIEGLCGDPLCETRVRVRLMLPDDDAVVPPCDRCAAAVVAAMVAAQDDLLRNLRSADCHTVGPL